MGYGEIATALALSQELMKGDKALTQQQALDTILAKRASGEGWGKIAHELGLKLGHVVSEVHKADKRVEQYREGGEAREGREAREARKARETRQAGEAREADEGRAARAVGRRRSRDTPHAERFFRGPGVAASYSRLVDAVALGTMRLSSTVHGRSGHATAQCGAALSGGVSLAT